MRKYLISFVCVTILYLTTFSSYNTARANGLTDSPSFIDETLESVFTAIAVSVATASHAKENVEENVRVVYESVKSAYNTWSPVYKEQFINGILAIDGQMTITGDYLENLLGDYIASHIENVGLGEQSKKFDSDSWETITIPVGYSITVSVADKTYTLNNTKNAEATLRVGHDSFDFYLDYRFGSAGGRAFSVSRTNFTDEQWQKLTSFNKKGVLGFSEMLSIAGGSYTLNDLSSNTVISLENAPTDLGVKEFYDRALTSGLALGVPQNAPYAENGLPLTLGTDGLYLPDGNLYDGPINWQLQGNLTDAGTLVLPDIMVNGVPHVLVNGVDGLVLVDKVTGLPTNTTGVLENGGSVTATAPELTYVDGVPYFKTGDGTLVNVNTGEVVGTVTGEIPKENDTTGLWSKLWEFLMSILDVLKKILTAIIELPVKLLELLKALLLALFVPSSGWWDENIKGLEDVIWSDEIGEMVDGFESLGDGGGGKFESIFVSLMGVDGLKVIDADSINSILDTIHSWVRGVIFPLLVLFNINSMYKLIRGTSLVEATRGLANRSKGAE